MAASDGFGLPRNPYTALELTRAGQLPGYQSLIVGLHEHSKQKAASGTAKKAAAALNDIVVYRIDPTLVNVLAGLFQQSDYHVLRSAHYCLGELWEHIHLDEVLLKWLQGELNHRSSDARRVGALRLLGCLNVPPEVSSSLLTALLSILKSVQERLRKKESKGFFGFAASTDSTKSALLPLQGASMQAFCAHYPKDLQVLEHAIDGALSHDPVSARLSLRMLCVLSATHPVDVAKAIQGKLPHCKSESVFNITDQLGCVYLLQTCSAIVSQGQATSQKERLECLACLVYIASGGCPAAGFPGTAEALSCLARAGWSLLQESHPTLGKRLMCEEVISGVELLFSPAAIAIGGAPPCFGSKAATHKALSVAIECGRSWTKFAARSKLDAGPSFLESRPFSTLREHIHTAARHPSMAIRWHSMKALVWTAVSRGEWRECREACAKELEGKRVTEEVEAIIVAAMSRADTLPVLAEECLDFTVACVAARPDLVGTAVVIEVLQSWALRPNNDSGQLALSTTVAMLDLPQTPTKAKELRRIHKTLYWFVGEFAKELTLEGTSSSATQTIICQLQLGATYAEWGTRTVCLLALAKLALASDDQLRLRLYEFFHSFAKEPGTLKEHSLVHPVLRLLDRIFDRKAALRSRLEQDRSWAPHELQGLLTDHSQLTALIKAYYPRLPASFFPLGAESEALIALASARR